MSSVFGISTKRPTEKALLKQQYKDCWVFFALKLCVFVFYGCLCIIT